MKLNQTLLEKLEGLLKTLGFQVRYEKGNFRGGFCVLENQHIVVVNKFFPIESRCSTLIDVIISLPQPNTETLTPEQQKLLQQLIQNQPSTT